MTSLNTRNELIVPDRNPSGQVLVPASGSHPGKHETEQQLAGKGCTGLAEMPFKRETPESCEICRVLLWCRSATGDELGE